MSKRTTALVLLGIVGAAIVAPAHPADVSHLRVKLEHQRVEFRFSLNIATLARITVIDTDQSNTVSFAELSHAAPLVAEFLQRHVLISINDAETQLGILKSHECIWPNPEQSQITPVEAGQRFVDFTLVNDWPTGVQDVWLGFQWFEQLGDLHALNATFAQPGEHDTPVEFTVAEPEYLFDTGWEDHSLKTAAAMEPQNSNLPLWIGAVAATALILFSISRWLSP